MTDKQIKLDGSFIPMEKAIKAGLISEKDINVPSKRLDYTDKIHIELANYEQMERDIEKIIEPYQTEIEAEAFSLPTAIESILERKEQEYEKLRQYHNKCCEEFEKEKKEWLEKYNQVSRDFYSGKYCNAEKCQQLDQLKAENKDLQEQIRKHNDDMFKNPPEKRSYCKGCTLPYVSKKLKQTLTEIKEICGIGIVNGLSEEQYLSELRDWQARILNKISECEGNDENS